jgi:hypothetical protein
MNRRVKGALFLDYVRMIKAHKEIDWTPHLQQGDREFLEQRIDINSWYPMDVYERFGLAILEEIAHGDLSLAREQGRKTIDELATRLPELFVPSDPRETFMRFQVLRQSLFDFPAASIGAIHDGEARMEIAYGMSPKAEQAATFQSMGFLERLLELSGAEPNVTLRTRSWEGDETTMIVVKWKRVR